MPTRRQLLFAAAGAAAAGALGGCGGRPEPVVEEGDPLRLRVWDEAAAAAYETTLADFTAQTGLDVVVETLAWEDYWTQLPLDVAAERLPDVLWVNTANLAQLRTGAELLEVEKDLELDPERWEPLATNLYRDDEGLWAVPQLWDHSLLVANTALVTAAGGDPAALRAEPGAPTDPLRDLARAITVDEGGLHPGDEGFDPATRTVFGFSAHPDRTAILGPFIAAQGGRWQEEDGTPAFASAEGITAVQYLADLATGHLAPDPIQTTEEPQLCRTLFCEGKLGLLQTGTYDLHTLTTEIGDSFEWTLHPVVPGPQGQRPLVHAIGAVGVDSGDDERTAATVSLLSWLAGADGQRPLAENRLGIPAHRDLRSAWQDAWAEDGVDVGVLDLPTDAALPETGERSAIATGRALPIIAEVFRGESTADEALPRAQEEARSAMA